MGDDGDFGSETLDVLSLLLQKALRDEKREVGVARAGFLDAAVEFVAQLLPDGKAVGPKDDTSADRGVIGQFRANDDVVVPGREILAARRDFLLILLVGHQVLSRTGGIAAQVIALRTGLRLTGKALAD